MVSLLKRIGEGITLAALSLASLGLSGCAYNTKPDLVYENGKFYDRRAEVISSIVERDVASKEKTTLSNDSSLVGLSLVYRL